MNNAAGGRNSGRPSRISFRLASFWLIGAGARRSRALRLACRVRAILAAFRAGTIMTAAAVTAGAAGAITEAFAAVSSTSQSSAVERASALLLTDTVEGSSVPPLVGGAMIFMPATYHSSARRRASLAEPAKRPCSICSTAARSSTNAVMPERTVVMSLFGAISRSRIPCSIAARASEKRPSAARARLATGAAMPPRGFIAPVRSDAVYGAVFFKSPACAAAWIAATANRAMSVIFEESLLDIARIPFAAGGSLGGLSGKNGNGGRVDVAGQRLHERDEVLLFLRGQAERLDQLGTARASDAALVVMLDHGFESCDRAVVHVRAAPRDLAQSRRLERVFHLRDRRQELAAADVLAREADIVEAVVGEIPSAVALVAGGLGVEERKAALGVVRNGALVVLDPGVERRARRNHGPLIGRDRLGDRVGMHPFRRERCLEPGRVARDI